MSLAPRLFAATLVLTMTAAAAVKIEKTNYAGYPNSYRITNGEVELVVLADVGPRIIRYGFVGGQNLFREFKDQLGKSGENEFRPRGGHRVWVAPELVPETYALDNAPAAEVKQRGGELEVTGAIERETGLQKSMVIRLAPQGSRVDITHRVKNVKGPAREWAPWILTMMAPGGIGITGFPPRGTHPEVLPPTNPLVMWAFTDLSDWRWQFLKKYLILRQDSKIVSPQKIGHWNQHTWGAYHLGAELFLKQYEANVKGRYPDFGCSFEIFTNGETLELETLGPLVALAPGQTAEHVERWSLTRNVQIPKLDDETLDRVIGPLLAR